MNKIEKIIVFAWYVAAIIFGSSFLITIFWDWTIGGILFMIGMPMLFIVLIITLLYDEKTNSKQMKSLKEFLL